MNIAIIPARKGSKRIPGKNIKEFVGKPIINYSIKAALNSDLFDKVIVSTDSDDIADIALKAGAEVPFKRPAEISDDYSTTADVLHHSLDWLNEHNIFPHYICGIYATAPFLSPAYLKKGFDTIIDSGNSSVFGITTFPYCIFRALKIDQNDNIKMIWPENELHRSNDFPEAFHDAGQFYWLDAKQFLKKKRVFNEDASGIILPRYFVQDIDTPEDWTNAELLYKALYSEYQYGMCD